MDMYEGENLVAVVAFGYGPVLPGRMQGEGRVNTFGRITALAAGMVARRLRAPQVVITGGRTGGVYLPSEAALMADLVQYSASLPASGLVLEEGATNTLLNVVYVANILDQRGLSTGDSVFVAMGHHLPRIIEICAVVGLNGEYVASEDVVGSRSWRHLRLLERLLDPQSPAQAQVLVEQARWLRGMREIPEYWLPQMAEIAEDERLRRVLRHDRASEYVTRCGLNVDALSANELRIWLRSIPRIMPPV